MLYQSIKYIIFQFLDLYISNLLITYINQFGFEQC